VSPVKKDRYENPLCSRYASERMQQIFSPDYKFTTWHRLWLSLAENERALGLPVTAEQVAELRENLAVIDYSKCVSCGRCLGCETCRCVCDLASASLSVVRCVCDACLVEINRLSECDLVRSSLIELKNTAHMKVAFCSGCDVSSCDTHSASKFYDCIGFDGG
jgi:hypothetical protein